MSETTEQPVPGSEPAPEPQVTTEQPTEPTEQTPEQTPEQKEEARNKEDRRIAALRARLGAAEREQARQSAELEFYRQQAARTPQADETPEQRMARIEADADARAEERLLVRRFHEEGAAQFADWKQRCDDLVKMGADGQIAKLLVDTPGGVKIAAALAEDPAALERIANIQTPHGRAVALGKYAATLDDAPAPRAAYTAPTTTRAPAPIRPVTGRVSPTFNEYTASPDQLADHYMRQNLERQQRR